MANVRLNNRTTARRRRVSRRRNVMSICELQI